MRHYIFAVLLMLAFSVAGPAEHAFESGDAGARLYAERHHGQAGKTKRFQGKEERRARLLRAGVHRRLNEGTSGLSG